MASPLDALGAAAAVLQLVECGIELSKKAVEIYKSSQGQTKQAEELQLMTTTFRSMNDKLIAQYNQSPAVSTFHDRSIEGIARDCDRAAGALLSKLKEVQAEGSRNVAKSIAKAIQNRRHQGAIDEQQKKLRELRQLLNEHILRLVSDRTGDIARILDRLDQRLSGLGLDLHRHKNELLNALQHANHPQISESLAHVYREGEALLFRRDMLASLKYEEIRLRWGKIEEPTKETGNWVFAASSHDGPSFTTWLERGNGIFWITGKAGSGKSTLMKHIANHHRTVESLQTWANGRRLVLCSHYFWYLGAPMQRSYGGLLRSILYDALSQCPELIEHVCAQRRGEDMASRERRSDVWLLPELRQSIEALAGSGSHAETRHMCFCLFIDGLDEYDGQHDEVIRLLRDITRSDNLKICTSSRPWEVFQQSFAKDVEQGNTLILQEHTRADILKFIEHEIGNVSVKGVKAAADLNELKSEIVKKAQGVFLWVVLVVKKELKQGLLFADSITLLRKRLEQVPTELEDYFRVIFDRINEVYRQETARIFLTCMRAYEPLPIRAAELIISDKPRDMMMATRVDSGFDWEDEDAFEQVRRQVNGRCQDLLEIYPPTIRSGQLRLEDAYEMPRLQFLHRSVADYLGQTEMWNMLHARAGANFDASLTLFLAYTYLIKKAPSLHQHTCRKFAWSWSISALHHATDMEGSYANRDLLNELDSAMSQVFDGPIQSRHWTNYYIGNNVGSESFRSDQNLFERGTRDFLGHMIELGLTDHVRIMLKEQPDLLSLKQGRPYLDYALRVHKITRSMRRDGLPRVRIIELLLSMGAEVNEKVWIYDGRTLWDLYISYLWEIGEDSPESRQAAWLLIQNGVNSADTAAEKQAPESYDILAELFDAEEGLAMREAISKNRNGAKSWVKSLTRWWKPA